MTTILNRVATAVDAPPPADEALDRIVHQMHRNGRPVQQWTVTTWTQWLTGQVHGIECKLDPDDPDTWAADAVMECTKYPVRQFVVAVNLAPFITMGYAFEPTGIITEAALVFGQHAAMEELNGEGFLDPLLTNAHAFWGQAWKPQRHVVILGEEEYPQ